LRLERPTTAYHSQKESRYQVKKHNGTFESCHHCQSYVRLGGSFGDAKGYAATTRKLHRIAIARREKDSIMRDMGLTKVRGALGGTYWE